MGRVVGALLVLGTLAWADPVANGSFETGDLAGWADGGDTTSQVVATLDGGALLDPLIFPTAGNYFVVVGTGPGDIGLDGAPDTGSLQQSFLIMGYGGTVYFDWNFVTEELTGDGAPVLDFFQITLTRDGGPTYVLIAGDVTGAATFLTKTGTIDTVLGFSFIDPADADLFGVQAPDGSVFLEQTGWQHYAFFVGAGSYTLTFRVGEDFDGAFDTALLVDNVRVPEPAGLALFSALVVAGIARRRRR